MRTTGSRGEFDAGPAPLQDDRVALEVSLLAIDRWKLQMQREESSVIASVRAFLDVATQAGK